MDIKNNIIRLLTDGLISRVNDQRYKMSPREASKYDLKLAEIFERIVDLGMDQPTARSVVDDIFRMVYEGRAGSTPGGASGRTIEEDIEHVYKNILPVILNYIMKKGA